MPVSFIPSAEEAESRQKQTARKRRRNQNTEIDELASLLPIKQPATIADGIVARGRTQAIDKISVLRLTSAYLKFQQYMDMENKAKAVHKSNDESMTNLMTEALDGFLMVLDSDGTILYVSDSVTNVVGLTQHDVIGQSLTDITDEEDMPTIQENLQSKTTPPSTHLDGRTEMQHRQFYIRIKSSVVPGRSMQLSRFKSHIMMQVSGSLKVHIPFQSHMEPKQGKTEPQVLGFVGECRPIESTSSILEVTIPQSHFTSTINLDMTIISVEASVKEVVGYNPSDVVGTQMSDYFHPGDCKKMIPCEKALLRLGHAVSPVFRFMSSTGEWVWMQLEGMLRFKQGTEDPQFWEVKAKLLSQEDSRMKYIEYREMYAKNCDPNQDLLSPHKDPAVTACLLDTDNKCRKKDIGAGPIISSLKGAQVCSSLIDPVLHCREMGLSTLPGKVKRVLTENDADDFVIHRNKRFGWPIPDNLQERALKLEQMSVPSSQENGDRRESNIGTVVDNLKSPTEIQARRLSGIPDKATAMSDLDQALGQDLSSTLGSEQNGYQNQAISFPNTYSPSSSIDITGSHPHTLTPTLITPSHSVTSPPDSVLSMDPYPSPLSSMLSPPSVTSDLCPLSVTSDLSADLPLDHTPSTHALDTQNLQPNTSSGFDFSPFASNTGTNPSAVNFDHQNFGNVMQFGQQAVIPSQYPMGMLSSQQNGVHGTTYPSYPLNKTASVSSLSSATSPLNASSISSPLSANDLPLSPEQQECLDNILTDSSLGPISPEEVYHTTEENSLEQILSEVISLNQSGGRISVKCEVETSGDVRGYSDSGISVSANTEVDDIIQQLLS